MSLKCHNHHKPSFQVLSDVAKLVDKIHSTYFCLKKNTLCGIPNTHSCCAFKVCVVDKASTKLKPAKILVLIYLFTRIPNIIFSGLSAILNCQTSMMMINTRISSFFKMQSCFWQFLKLICLVFLKAYKVFLKKFQKD